jgi:hypothetical protein
VSEIQSNLDLFLGDSISTHLLSSSSLVLPPVDVGMYAESSRIGCKFIGG